MKNGWLLLCLMIFIGIFSFGYCRTFQKVKQNNESVPIQYIDQNNYNNKRTSLLTLNSSIAEGNNDTMHMGFYNTFEENPNITGSHIFKDKMRFKRNNRFYENKLRNAGIFLDQKTEEIDKLPCKQKRDIYKTLEYIFYSYTQRQIFFYFRSTQNSSIFCESLFEYDPKNITNQLIEEYEEIKRNFDASDTEIICNTHYNKESCDALEKVNFYESIGPNNITELIEGIQNFNDCNLRLIALIFSLIDGHDIFAIKCCSEKMKDSINQIRLTLLPLLTNLTENIKAQETNKTLREENDCFYKETSCISREMYNKYSDLSTIYELKGNEPLNCNSVNGVFQYKITIFVLLLCLLLYFKIGS